MNRRVDSIAQLLAVDIERGCMRHSTVRLSDQRVQCLCSNPRPCPWIGWMIQQGVRSLRPMSNTQVHLVLWIHAPYCNPRGPYIHRQPH